ncbi:phospholipase D-like domain-containing protein [Sphingosinicella sp. YJ22]|uniref:phospholipase D-like domain-containing protein n=1 Tax=Sphingosinicella sp. YJ22 TaxID=1104780 RepID=UPI001FAEFEFF|nr:phospholipase D-like domain-containing protein [Sphingosinicella sp. YJ22]
MTSVPSSEKLLSDLHRHCWRVARAHRASLIVDAADYFRLARKAMCGAQKQILLVGWDFDTRICLDYEADDGAPTELGAFISWLTKERPGLEIYILKWDVGAIQLLARGTTVLRVARWVRNPNVHFKLDGAHAAGASHHQKIVVIDDALAFCGGIDMTGDRWDTRGHCDEDEHRKRPTTHRRYDPWHDATMAVDGKVAEALGALARDRWKAAGGEPIDPPQSANRPWPDGLEPHFRDVDIAIARTRSEYGEQKSVREIEDLFVEMIKGAKRFIYAENQYFASRVIAEAIVERLKEPDPPEFVIVNPRTGSGWLDDEVMSPARAELMELIGEHDRHGRFRIYSPVTEGGEDIYVHSKIMIVDDRQLRVGSANLNNRSMGFDSECDLMIDAGLPSNAEAGDTIAMLRSDLLAEHLGKTAEAVAAAFAETGSLIRAIDRLRGDTGRRLVPLEPKTPNKVERAVVEKELLDPESANGEFEPIARPGLLARARRRGERGSRRR